MTLWIFVVTYAASVATAAPQAAPSFRLLPPPTPPSTPPVPEYLSPLPSSPPQTPPHYAYSTPPYSAQHSEPQYPDVPPKYTFNYTVNDASSRVNFGHSEARDGDHTDGSYTVDLPDGRKKIVTYKDKGDGLKADVNIMGTVNITPIYDPVPNTRVPEFI